MFGRISFKIVIRPRRDEVVGEIFRKLLLVPFCNAGRSLLAQQSLVLRRHELTPRGETFGFGHRETLRLVDFSLDLADHVQRHTVPTEHAADCHEAQEAHEEIAHATGRAADIRHLGENDFKFVHHFLPDAIEIGEMRALAQHRFGEVKTLAHRGLHCTAMGFVIGVNHFRHRTLLQQEPTVTGGSVAAQSMVPAVQRKKIYCKATAYR
jgi:hypothetical protein